MSGRASPVYLDIEIDEEEVGKVVFGLPASDLHWMIYIPTMLLGLLACGALFLYGEIAMFLGGFLLLATVGYFTTPSGADLELTAQEVSFVRRWRRHSLPFHQLTEARIRKADRVEKDRILEFRRHDGTWVEGPRFEEGHLAASPEQMERMMTALRERIEANASRRGSAQDVPESLAAARRERTKQH